MTALQKAAVAGSEVSRLKADLDKHYQLTLARLDGPPDPQFVLRALAMTIKDRLIERWRVCRAEELATAPKRVFYLSLEFLLGRSLSNAILSLDLAGACNEVLADYGMKLEDLYQLETDAGLGNGGLGRLAACFLDSSAMLQLPVTGYGIRYQYGMFNQRIEHGRQVESPDNWLREGNPWETERPESTRRVKFNGHTEYYRDDDGALRARWAETEDVLAVPYDIPIPGYRNNQVNTLRLWRAAATDEFNLHEFNAGDYTEAVAAKNEAEQITMVLYPNDASENGKELRLRQQYFLASASLQDVLAEWVAIHGEDFSGFAQRHRFQLNDTHPTFAVAELMRLLLDEHKLGWDQAWAITQNTMAYTNHTLLPEALEKWPVRMLRHWLPRLMDIIFEINARFLSEVAVRWPGDVARQARMSLIEEGHDPQVRMAYLAIVASFSVNGVAALHSALLQRELFRDFYELWPHKFNNKTNGVTPRRWLSHCNPALAKLVDEVVGPEWRRDLNKLSQLKPYADDRAFGQRWHAIKQANKIELAKLVKAKCDVQLDTDFMFDVQVKRIHEYKRQLLNVLHIIHLYDRIKRGDAGNMYPRAVIIGGKAAPGYVLAKLIIKLVNNVAAVINSDPAVTPLLQVAFVPNYHVSSMEVICPGTDLSEQISTAGKEASGTGNMKFMMNGAVTIGTYDGANIEILEAVGLENFFLFGLRVEEIAAARRLRRPSQIIDQDQDLKRVMQLLECGHFNMFEPHIFDPIVESIRNPDSPWMVAADFRSYVEAQRKAAETYQDRNAWVRMSILNTASSGRFSSDNTIAQYAREIWGLEVGK